MTRRPVLSGIARGHGVLPAGRIWLHLVGEGGAIEDPIALSVDEARDVIETLQGLLAQIAHNQRKARA